MKIKRDESVPSSVQSLCFFEDYILSGYKELGQQFGMSGQALFLVSNES